MINTTETDIKIIILIFTSIDPISLQFWPWDKIFRGVFCCLIMDQFPSTSYFFLQDINMKSQATSFFQIFDVIIGYLHEIYKNCVNYSVLEIATECCNKNRYIFLLGQNFQKRTMLGSQHWCPEAKYMWLMEIGP